MAINAHQVRSECVYQTSEPSVGILTDLDAIDQLANRLREQRKTIRWISLGVLMVGVALVLVGPGFMVVGIVAAVLVFIYSFFAGGALVANSGRTGLARDMMRIVAEDIGPGTPISIDLGLKSREGKIREEPWAGRKKGKQQFLRDEMLSIQGRLLDGADFTQTVVKLLRIRTYTNPRGKSKTKSRARYLITVRLKYPAETYSDLRPVHKAMPDTIRVPQGAVLKRLSVTEKAIVALARVNSENEVKAAGTALFLGAYRMLNRSRQLAARGGAR